MTRSRSLLGVIGGSTESSRNTILGNNNSVLENGAHPKTDDFTFRLGNEFDSLHRSEIVYRDSFMREFDKGAVDERSPPQSTYNYTIPGWDIPAHYTSAPPTTVKETTPLEDLDAPSHVWTYFCTQTTFHGFKNTVSPERKRVTRIFWFFLVFCAMLGLLYSVLSLLIDYYKYETITSTDVEISAQANFPSVTICNNCPYRDAPEVPDIIRQVVANVSNFPGLANVNYSDPYVQESLAVSMVYIRDTYSFRADDFILSASYEGKDLNVSESFQAVDTSIGRCFVFNGPDSIATNGPRIASTDGRDSGLRMFVNLHQDSYFLYSDLSAGIRTFIASYPETPRLLKDGVDIHPGTSSRVALQPVKYTFLPWPYLSYGGESCDDRPNKELVSKMINATVYSYDSCLEQCSLQHCSYQCSCYLSNLYVDGLPDCTLGQTLFCHMPCTMSGNWTQLCDCPRPCTLNRYDTVVSASQLPSRVAGEFFQRLGNISSTAALREDVLDLRVYLDTMMVRHERHAPKYTFNSMFAFLGGQMGFFMGASLVTLSELLETLAFSIYVCFNKLMRMGQLGNNTKLKSGAQQSTPAVHRQASQKLSESETTKKLPAVNRTHSVKSQRIKQAW